jgi:thioredoxin 1
VSKKIKMDINKDELKEVLENNELVVIDFWASWCGPCRLMGPKFNQFAEANPDVPMYKVEIDKNQGVGQEFGLKSIPAILYFKDGEEVARLMGMQGHKVLQDKLEEVQNG